jgi:hypothetical protein
MWWGKKLRDCSRHTPERDGRQRLNLANGRRLRNYREIQYHVAS